MMNLHDEVQENPCIKTLWQRIKATWASYGLTGDHYTAACVQVADNLNYQAGYPCALGVFTVTNDAPKGINKDCYFLGEVQCIISAYINGVLDGKIPEYNRKSLAEMQATRNYTATTAGFPEPRVGAVLDALYYATKNNQLKSDIYLFPKTYKQNVDARNVPGIVASTDWDFSTIVKWSAIGVAGVLILATVYNITKR